MTPQNEYHSEFPSILDVLTKPIHNLVLLYGDSDPETFKALGFTVNQQQRRIEHITNLPTLDNGDTLDLGFMGESGHSEDVASPGDDQLEIGGNYEETVEEWGLAVTGDDIRVGVENPQNAPITGLQDDDVRGFDSSNFRQEGAVRSQHTRTPGGLPTTALSATPWQGLFRIDSEENGRNHTYIGFDNVSGDDNVTPNVLAYGASYRVVNRSPEKVQQMINPSNKDMKARVAVWGGFENDHPNLPNEWHPNVLTLDSDDFADIMGGI